mgnify:FL=1
MQPINFSNIQSLILYAYKDLHHAAYLMLHIEQPDLFKQWLGDNVENITISDSQAESTALNIAFTAPGLHKLNLSQHTYQQFSREFKEGIATNKRSQLLGDEGSNSPENWNWGGSSTPEIDVLLLCYADSDSALKAQVSHITTELEAYTTQLQKLDTQALFDRKEHFGFKDGLSQPKIAEIHTNAKESNTLAPGEFLLGQESGYGTTTPFPHDNDNFKHFGKDGSYLVFRQLEQDVKGFWHYLDQQNTEEDTKIYLAAKMVGRWPNGAPISLFPTQEPDHLNPTIANDFNYSDDPQGNHCPMASHIRRTNPRATDLGLSNEKDNIASVNHHRIMRRGRPYGKPLHKHLSPTAMMKADDTEPRGLHFLCFNADLARQFEFIQQTWVNNEKFNGLYNDLDPLLGTRPKERGLSGDDFTISQKPMRHKLKSIPQFVTTKGGAYFFMPSISALTQLANCN